MEEMAEHCGYLASFLGTLIEGELLLLASVISAKMGHFNYFGAMGAAFMGAFTQDSIKFLMTKKYGNKLLDKKPKLQSKLDRTSAWFDKRPFFYLTLNRMMYGFSTAILLLSALKDMSYTRFAIHSAIGVLLWVVVVGGLGYFFAEMMVQKLNFLKTYSPQVIGVLAVVGLIYWFFFKRPYDKHCFKPIAE